MEWNTEISRTRLIKLKGLGCALLAKLTRLTRAVALALAVAPAWGLLEKEEVAATPALPQH